MMGRRMAAAVACAGVLAMGLAAVPSASAASTFMVGDSIALGAQQPLQAGGVAVDAAVSRTFSQGLAVLRAQGGALPASVIVHLGTNGGVTAGQCDELAALLGKGRSLTLVNVNIPASPQVASSTNAVLAACARRHGATLVDWAGYTRSNPQVLCGDGIHISCGGGPAYASFVLSKAAAPSAGAPAAGAAPAAPTAPAASARAAAPAAGAAASPAAAAADPAAAAAAQAAALAEQQRQAAIQAEQERIAAEAARLAAARERVLQRVRSVKAPTPLEIDQRVNPENYRFTPFVVWLTDQ